MYKLNILKKLFALSIIAVYVSLFFLSLFAFLHSRLISSDIIVNIQILIRYICILVIPYFGIYLSVRKIPNNYRIKNRKRRILVSFLLIVSMMFLIFSQILLYAELFYNELLNSSMLSASSTIGSYCLSFAAVSFIRNDSSKEHLLIK